MVQKYDTRTELGNLSRLRDERSRALTAENQDGAVGADGRAASPLGEGGRGGLEEGEASGRRNPAKVIRERNDE